MDPLEGRLLLTATTIELMDSAGSITTGQKEVFTAMVTTGSGDTALAGGTVSFFDNGTKIGQAASRWRHGGLRDIELAAGPEPGDG